jgi:hypothetical protein
MAAAAAGRAGGGRREGVSSSSSSSELVSDDDDELYRDAVGSCTCVRVCLCACWNANACEYVNDL